jgi:uncharacterized membrane protein
MKTRIFRIAYACSVFVCTQIFHSIIVYFSFLSNIYKVSAFFGYLILTVFPVFLLQIVIIFLTMSPVRTRCSKHRHGDTLSQINTRNTHDDSSVPNLENTKYNSIRDNILIILFSIGFLISSLLILRLICSDLSSYSKTGIFVVRILGSLYIVTFYSLLFLSACALMRSVNGNQ